MDKKKLIKSIIAGVLACSTITFGIISGIKTAQTTRYSKQVTQISEDIDNLKFADTEYQYSVPDTENYNKVKAWEEDRKAANENYNASEENIIIYASLAFISGFGLVYLGVDSLRRR